MPTATQQASGGNAKAPAARPQVFRVGVYETDTPDIDTTLASTVTAWTQQKLGTYKLSPNGWLAGIWNLFQMTVSGNAATVAYANDAPFSLIFKVTFRDVGNREVFGPLTGYEWFTVNKWGGYFPGEPDPRNSANGYAAVAGVGGGAGGSFSFLLYLPLEIVYRDTLGEIENKSSSSSYTMEIYVDAAANVYGGPTGGGTAPTGTATMSLRHRANLIGYTEPEATDSSGRPLAQQPPAAGTVQYWASETFNSAVGTQKYNQQNGIGYSIRNLAYIVYDASSTAANNTRANGYNYTVAANTAVFTGGEFPDPVTLAFGKVQLFQRPIAMWANLMTKWFGLFTAPPDANGSLENGVLIQPFNREFDTIAGNELRNGYLVTKAGNVLQISGTYVTQPTNTHIVTNYIVPPGNDASRLRAR
jgi:hypothetical protein